MSKRIKPKSLATREEFEASVNAAADADVLVRYLAARRDVAVARLKARYEAKIAEQENIRTTQAALAERYATEHRAELLPDEEKLKSGRTAAGTWGWRTGNPTLKPLKGFTWTKVMELLKRLKYRRWIRVKQEPAKDAMLLSAKKRTPKVVAALAKVGVEVVQEEAFFIEANVGTAEAIKSEAAA